MHSLLFALLLPAVGNAETPVAERAAPATATDTWTLALGLGFGQQYAGLGANAAAYLRVHGIFSIGAFGSVGLVDLDTCCNDWGWTAGASATWGWHDRLALTASYGAIWNERVAGDDRVVNGVTVAVGYELLSRAGFWFRWLIGAAFPTDELRVDDMDVIPSINVGLGWSL